LTFDNYSIRPIELNDALDFFQLVENNRPRISTYFPGIVSKTKTFEETKSHIAERIAGAASGKYMIYLIIDNLTKKFAGVVQLKDIDTNARKREVGFFVDSNYERKGIATKSILAACDFCFNTMNLNKVFMRIAEENIASRRVAEKCGFKIEGKLRDDFTTSDGKLITLFYYGLLRMEFWGV
jgi:RimJ/RimL family protein N-acetyltransferase